jgi:hypothetical protein
MADLQLIFTEEKGHKNTHWWKWGWMVV